MQRTRSRPGRYALTAWAAVIAAAVAAPAAAETLMEVSAAVNVSHDRTRTDDAEVSGTGLDARPAFVIQVGTPRLVWRAGYLFSGNLMLDGQGSDSYSNHLDLSLAAELTERSTLGITLAATQGDTEFRLSQRAAEQGAPALRAPETPALVTATLGEAFAWESSEHLRMSQDVDAATTARQDDLDRRNVVLTASFGVARLYPRDELGLTYAPRLAVLRTLVGEPGPITRTVTNSALVSWNHDFSPRWNGQASAGVEHVNPLDGATAASFHPTGALVVRYFAGDAEAALTYTHSATANLEMGTMSLADGVVLNGVLGFGANRQLGASAGYMRSRALAGTPSARGEAVSGDVGLVWGFTEEVVATARYSLAYQFGQGPGSQPSLVQVVLVGFAMRYGNTPYVPPVPTIGGGRVDRGDAVGFPGAERDAEQAPSDR